MAVPQTETNLCLGSWDRSEGGLVQLVPCDDRAASKITSFSYVKPGVDEDYNTEVWQVGTPVSLDTVGPPFDTVEAPMCLNVRDGNPGNPAEVRKCSSDDPNQQFTWILGDYVLLIKWKTSSTDEWCAWVPERKVGAVVEWRNCNEGTWWRDQIAR
jgi:hypothetical protein